MFCLVTFTEGQGGKKFVQKNNKPGVKKTWFIYFFCLNVFRP